MRTIALSLLFAFQLPGAAFALGAYETPVQVPSSIPMPLSTSEQPLTHWKLVQEADAILRVRVVRKGVRRNHEAFPASEYQVLTVIKGGDLVASLDNSKGGISKTPRGKGTIKIHSFLDPTNFSIVPGKEALAFFQIGHDADSLYTVLHEGALQPYTPEGEAAIRHEMQNQDEMAAAVRATLRSNTFPHEAEVQALVNRFLDPSILIESAVIDSRTFGQEEDLRCSGSVTGSLPVPLQQLEDLGTPALLAMVKQLDDRRLLPGNRIALSLSLSRWRTPATMHTRFPVEKVLDVLAVTLNQVFREGDTCPLVGDPEWIRDRCVRHWYLFLGHSPEWRRALVAL